MKKEYEKEFDDEVYEDEFYEEELKEESDLLDDKDPLTVKSSTDDDEEEDDDDDDDDDFRVGISYVCDDCDYRWDDFVIQDEEIVEERDDQSLICPMCGSMNVSQI